MRTAPLRRVASANKESDMDDNELGDGAYEARARRLLEALAWVLALFFVGGAILAALSFWPS